MASCICDGLMHLVVLTFLALVVDAEHRWNYNPNSTYGPFNWGQFYPDCGNFGDQSPIDIDEEHVIEDAGETLKDLEFVNYVQPIPKFKLLNTGHSLKIDLPRSVELRLRGASMKNWFVLEQLHFHWGQTDEEGSEHFLNGQAFPLEIHLVHKSLTPDMDENLFTVLALICEISEEENEVLDTVLGYLAKVQYKKNTLTVEDSLNISGLIPPQKNDYFLYHGSFTTPPCSPIVTFIVAKNRCKVTPYQLILLRSLFESLKGKRHQLMLENFRPIQPLGDRKVWHYYNPREDYSDSKDDDDIDDDDYDNDDDNFAAAGAQNETSSEFMVTEQSDRGGENGTSRENSNANRSGGDVSGEEESENSSSTVVASKFLIAMILLECTHWIVVERLNN